MSAPDTNVEKQAKNHKGPLLGMPAVVIAALLLFFAFLGWTAMQANDPVPTSAIGSTATDG